MSEFTTIGLISSISGNSLMLFTNFMNLSSFISLGLFGLALTSPIFTFSVTMWYKCTIIYKYSKKLLV